MKKILSLTLAVMLLVSMIPTAFATTNYTNGTQVEYIADADTNREYTITVPALLNPGQSGTVTLRGKWASNETVKVTADASVELTNSINAADKCTLTVTFPGIEKAGDNVEEKTYTESVTVAEMPADALFGTWSGKFNYNVEYVDTVMFKDEWYYYGPSDDYLMFGSDGFVYTLNDEKQKVFYGSGDGLKYTTNGQQLVAGDELSGTFTADGTKFINSSDGGSHYIAESALD